MLHLGKYDHFKRILFYFGFNFLSQGLFDWLIPNDIFFLNVFSEQIVI
jgi:hypothetical protein